MSSISNTRLSSTVEQKRLGRVLEALEGQVRAQRPFVLVVGASGSGKSSLVRAGVLPLLTQPETIEGVGLWRWSVTRPGAGGSGGDCFDALAAALLEPAALPALQDPESPERNPRPWERTEGTLRQRRSPGPGRARSRRAGMENPALPFPGGKRAPTPELGKIGRRGRGSTAEGEVRAAESPFGVGG